MNDDAVITRCTEPLSQGVDGETVIFHPGRGSYFSLGAVGSRVWELVEQPMAVGELCQRLVDEYDVEPDRCRREIRTLICELDDAGLVRTSLS